MVMIGEVRKKRILMFETKLEIICKIWSQKIESENSMKVEKSDNRVNEIEIENGKKKEKEIKFSIQLMQRQCK